MVMDKHGSFLGMIPYDFRKPTFARLKRRMWNPREDRMIVPRSYGAGWTLNLYRLRQKYPWLFYLLLAGALFVFGREAYRYFTAADEEEE